MINRWSCTIMEKAPTRAFSVIVKTDCGTDGALHSTSMQPTFANIAQG